MEKRIVAFHIKCSICGMKITSYVSTYKFICGKCSDEYSVNNNIPIGASFALESAIKWFAKRKAIRKSINIWKKE